MNREDAEEMRRVVADRTRRLAVMLDAHPTLCVDAIVNDAAYANHLECLGDEAGLILGGIWRTKPVTP